MTPVYWKILLLILIGACLFFVHTFYNGTNNNWDGAIPDAKKPFSSTADSNNADLSLSSSPNFHRIPASTSTFSPTHTVTTPTPTTEPTFTATPIVSDKTIPMNYSTGPCFLRTANNDPVEPRNNDTGVNNVFMLITQPNPPRAYIIGLDSFLRHHPNMTVEIYGGVNPANIPMTLQSRIRFRYYETPSDLATFVFQKINATFPETWERMIQHEFWPNVSKKIVESPMVLSDVLRLTLLSAYGGTWLDADAIYLRNFAGTFEESLYTGISCYTHSAGPVYCSKSTGISTIKPAKPSSDIISVTCTNGLLVNFPARHPFLLHALEDGLEVYNSCKSCNTLFGARAFGAFMSAFPAFDSSHWPQLYDLNYLFGFAGYGLGPSHKDDYLNSFHGNITMALEDLNARRVVSVQIYSYVYKRPELYKELFRKNGLYDILWQRNCNETCSEPP